MVNKWVEAVNQLVTAAPRVLVVGDVMLDRYWFGGVERISPEAPVPVVAVNNIDDQLGGAANVARNLVDLGSRVKLLSVVGRDEAGQRIQALLEQAGIDSGVQVDPSATTTIKLRVIAQHQQLIRLDFEQPPDHEVLLEVLDDYRRALESTDVVILSDYGKGGLLHLDQMIQMARDLNIPILVDPKGRDFSRYRGASLITPNRKEFIEAWGDWQDEQQLSELAQELIESLGVESVLLTRSEEGMTLFRSGVSPSHQPAQAQEVYDVSGAGDTVIATVAVALGAGLGDDQALQLATAAAGIVVGKLGVATATLAELQQAGVEV